jgi:hypothetical protein
VELNVGQNSGDSTGKSMDKTTGKKIAGVILLCLARFGYGFVGVFVSIKALIEAFTVSGFSACNQWAVSAIISN